MRNGGRPAPQELRSPDLPSPRPQPIYPSRGGPMTARTRSRSPFRYLLAALAVPIALAAAAPAAAQTLYAGVWRGGSDAYSLWGGVDWNSFTAKWQELAGQNQRLVDIDTYVDGGQRKYIGVWRAGTDAYSLLGGATWAAFE